jgi:hypothetical protein
MDKFNDDYKLLLFTLKRKHPTLTRDYLRLVYLIVVTVGDELWQIVDISSAKKNDQKNENHPQQIFFLIK